MYFGTDPEYPVVNLLGHPVPAHKLGFGDKNHKKLLSGYNGRDWESRAFRDGYMIEINIRPTQCRQTLTFGMQRALSKLTTLLPKGHRLVSVPAVKINLKKDMKNAPADVLQFGCEPSYCAYELEAKSPLIDASTHPYRYAGGHLHFGYNGQRELAWMKTKAAHPAFVRMCDRYIGLPLTYLFDSKQTFLRRRFYGQAGEYRSQKYGPTSSQVGVEYRTPGPEVWNTPWVASYALGVGRFLALNYAQMVKEQDRTMDDDIRAAINEGTGLEKLWKAACLPAYRESVDFRRLKKYAPKSSNLRYASGMAVEAGFYDWAIDHRLVEQ